MFKQDMAANDTGCRHAKTGLMNQLKPVGNGVKSHVPLMKLTEYSVCQQPAVRSSHISICEKNLSTLNIYFMDSLLPIDVIVKLLTSTRADHHCAPRQLLMVLCITGYVACKHIHGFRTIGKETCYCSV